MSKKEFKPNNRTKNLKKAVLIVGAACLGVVLCVVGAAALYKISTLARHDMEKFMGTQIYLETWVKVKENWRDNVNYVRSLGYRED